MFLISVVAGVSGDVDAGCAGMISKPGVPAPAFGAAAAPATPKAKVTATANPPAASLNANFGGLTNFLRASCVAGGRTEMGAAIDPTAYIEAERGPVSGRLGRAQDGGNRHGG